MYNGGETLTNIKQEDYFMFITVTLLDGREMYMDTSHIAAITGGEYCREGTKILIGGWSDRVYVRETPEEVLNKIQNAK